MQSFESEFGQYEHDGESVHEARSRRYDTVKIMTHELSERSTVVAVKDQVSSDLGGEVAILDLAGGVYYGLDTVGARVWELVQKPIEVHEIQETIIEEYDVNRARVEQDVHAFLEQLTNEGLVEVRDDVSA